MPIPNIDYNPGQDSMQDVFDITNDVIDEVNILSALSVETETTTGFVVFSSSGVTSPTVQGKAIKQNGLVYMSLRIQGTPTGVNVGIVITVPAGFELVESTVLSGMLNHRNTTVNSTNIVIPAESGFVGIDIDSNNRVNYGSGSSDTIADLFTTIITFVGKAL